MNLRGWHIVREAGALTLHRPGRGRMDVSVSRRFPAGDLLRYALQIRQDLWRALQALRGYSPIVRVTREKDEVVVFAGGQFDYPAPRQIEQRIASVLDNSRNRQRWITQAQKAAP